LISQLREAGRFAFRLVTTDADPKIGRPLASHFRRLPSARGLSPCRRTLAPRRKLLGEFRPLFQDERVTKLGHGIKSDLGFLKCYDIEIRGTLFDTMVAHSLIEPDMRHTLDYLAESCFGYRSIAPSTVFGDPKASKGQLSLAPESLADYAAEQLT